MKRFPSFLIVFILLIVACNNNKSKDSVTLTSKDGDETVTIDPNQMQNAAEDMVRMKEEMIKLNPRNTNQ